MASGYGSLMDEENQQPQSQQASGYGALMDDEATQSKAAIAQSVSMAVDADPDRKAKVLELSQKTNMPPELVERNFDELNKQHTVESMNYAELMDKNPGLSESLKDQNFAAVAKDDIDALKKLEKSTHEYSFLSKAYDSLNYGLDQMYTDAAKIPALIYDIGAAPQNLFMKAIGKPERQVSAPDWLRNNPIAKFYERGKDAFHVDEMDQSITEKLTNIKSAKDLADAGKTFAIQFMANAPQQALLLASYAAGLGEAGLVQTGLSTAAGSAAESAQEGKDPLSSTVSAVTKGTIESAFESLGTFGMLKSMEGKIARQVGKDASQTIMKDFFQTMLYSVASEGNEEFWTSVAQDYTDYVTGNNPDALKGILTRASDAFVLGGASGGLMTGPTGAAVASHRAHKVRQAQLASDFYKSLGESAGESKLRERLPEAHKNYVEKLTKGGPIENIFIPVDAVTAYMQSGKGGANVLGELGIAKQYDQAKETGQDIQVPLANWIDATTKSDRFMDFANDVKFSENDSTVNQEKQISTELKAEAEKVLAERNEKIETESKEVVNNVETQLVETGKYNEADAKIAAQVWGDFFRVQSERSQGEFTPKQLFDRYIGKIQAGETPTPMFRDDSKWRLPTDKELSQEWTDDGEEFFKTTSKEKGQPEYTVDDYINLVKNYGRVVRLSPDQISKFDPLSRETVLSGKEGYRPSSDKLTEGMDKGEKIAAPVILDFGNGSFTQVSGRHRFGHALERNIPIDVIVIPYGVHPRQAQGDTLLTMNQSAKPKFKVNYLEDDGSLSIDAPEVKASGEFGAGGDFINEWLNPEGVYKDSIDLEKVGLSEFENPFVITDIEVPEENRRSGVGTDAVKSLEAEAASRGADVILLNASPMGTTKKAAELPGLIKFYESLGYKVLRKSKENAEMFKPVDKTKTLFQSKNTAPNELGFYSKLQQTIEQKMGNSATVEQVRGIIKEMKPEEIKWSGIDEFLKSKLDEAKQVKETDPSFTDKVISGEGFDEKTKQLKNLQTEKNLKISKQELLDFLRSNQVDIKEITKGGATAEDVAGEYYIDQGPENSPYPFAVRDWAGNAIESFKTEEQAQDFIDNRANVEDATKFSQYTLPGGENYREVLLTMPPSGKEIPSGYKVMRYNEFFNKAALKGQEFLLIDKGNRIAGIGPTQEAAIADFNKVNPDRSFTSSHFDEPNILAHVRLNDRVDADGKKVLFVEEIQSDWHQKGRKQGYVEKVSPEKAQEISDNFEKRMVEKYAEKLPENKRDTATIQDVRDFLTPQEDAEWTQSIRLFNTAHATPGAGVPDAPFKKSWHEFALKRIIRMAAEQGYDRVAWTTGEQQAERYDLSKQIDEIEYIDNGDGTYDLGITGKDGSSAGSRGGVTIEQVEEYVGKEIAEKIKKKEGKKYRGHEGRTLEGLDLKVGGEGMKGFYDKILVDAANKLGKKFGAKVGETDISVSEGPTDEISFMVSKNPDEQWAVFKSIASGSSIPEEVSTHKTKAEAKTEAARLNSEYVSESKNTKVHSLDITPELKNAAINEGFSLFQPGQDEPRGSATFDKNRNVIINLFKTADLSTFLHESGHVFLEIMGDLAQADGAPTKVKDDYSKLLKWLGVESRDQIKTEHHEQLARGFEAYLMEGKAPTTELRSAFARIKTWMLALYKSVQNLNVELNDDIRGVFDRWLATEQEIADANREVNYEPLFKDPAGFGMSGSQAVRYQKAIDDSRMAAEEQLAARLISDYERRKTAQYKERFKIIAAEIEQQANQMNIYKLLYALQKNTQADGSPLPDGMPTQIKIDRASATKEFGYDPNRLPSRVLSTIKDGGFHPAMLAEMFGFERGDALLRELANSVPKKDYIEREANARIKQEFPDIYEDGKIHDEAIKYIHNNMKSKLMLMELEHMATNHLPAMKDVIKKIARRVPTEKAVREQAVKIIADRKITDIRPHLFLRAETKAAKESGVLFTKGDFEGAFNAKRRELLNHELYRAAIEAQEDIDKSQDKFKRLFKPDEKIAKSRDMDYVNAARAILAQYGLAKTDKTAAQYIKPIMDYDPDTYQAVAAIIDSATQNAGPWEQIKYDDYVAVKDAVISLWALAKTSKEIEIDGKRESRDEAMAFLTARIAELSKTDQKAEYTRSKTKWEKSKLMLMGTRSALRRVESWIDSMDGTAGKMFRKYIWNPVKESETNYKIAKLPLIKKFLEIVKPIEQTLVKKEIIAHELLDNRGRKYVFRSKAELLGAILHAGNDSNLSKLLRGYGWGQFNDDGSLDRRRWDSFVKRMWDEGVLTKADYDVMQATWDLMESIKPEAQKAHKKMYGHYFSEVTANEIVTPWGVYRGGYVPAKVDPNNPQASARQDKENLEKNGNSYAFPTTGRGATKTRVEAYAAPLMMDLNLIPAHIDWAMRFIHIEPAIKDVSKILLNREFQSRLNEFDQTAMSDMLVPWLQRTGQQKVSMPSQGQAGRMLDTVSKFLRRNSGMAIMFGNVLNTAQQFTGVLPATIKVKQRFLRNALWALTRSPAKTAEMINEKSKFMQTRSGNQLLDVQKDINDLLLNPSKYERFTDFTQKHAYFMQGFTQGVVDSVVWVGAYDQAVENGLDEKEAVREADSAVRLTQGSFDASDVSRYSTGSPFQRLFTMFFDYFNMLGNLMGTEYATTMREMGLKKGAGRMLYVYVFAFMGTAVISEAIMKLGGGKLDEDDDDEYMDDFISMFFGSQFRTLTAMLPGGSAVTNYVSNKFSDKRVFDDRISLSPSIKMIEQTVNAPFSIYEAIANDGSEKKAVRDVLTAVSLLSGIPVAPLARPIGYQIDVNEGNASPSGPIDYTRGLVTGRSSQ